MIKSTELAWLAGIIDGLNYPFLSIITIPLEKSTEKYKNIEEVDILNDMIVVKESESLLYKVNPIKHFKQIYYNKKGREVINSLLNYEFNFFDFGLGNKFSYFEKYYTETKYLSFLPSDKSRYCYTFSKDDDLIKEEFAEGSQPTPFYFKHKSLKLINQLFFILKSHNCACYVTRDSWHRANYIYFGEQKDLKNIVKKIK
jgi:hypothetical protein